jgi:Ca2+-transporting ATPase
MMDQNTAWHALTAETVAQKLGTDTEAGLSWKEAKARSSEYISIKSDSGFGIVALKILWRQFKGGVIVVLSFATMLTWILGHTGDAIGIGASVLFSVFFGFITDFRAERSLAALKSLSVPKARVIREGLEHEIQTHLVQAGDIMILTGGHIVAADGRLIETRDLQIDESLLTGESLTVVKNSNPLESPTPLADRKNMAYAGSLVRAGYGKMIVTAVRHETELGRIGKLVSESKKEETPLEKQEEQLGHQLALLVIALSAGITVLGLFRHHPLWIMIETGVILAIAAIPEGLPAVTTVALAAGVHRMAQAHSLVRRLSSVETLGSVSVICTDKTGTLTENVMRVTRIVTSATDYEVTGSGYEPKGQFLANGKPVELTRDSGLRQLLLIGSLCNNAEIESHEGWHIHGSSTEGALLTVAIKGGLSLEELNREYTRLNEFAFSSERKRMAVLMKDTRDRVWSFVKGSPEMIMSRCSQVLLGSTPRAMTPEFQEVFERQSRQLGNTGHRVLALAYREMESPEIEKSENDLIWTGLVGIMDPPREGVERAISELQRAGIRTVMVTGDQKTTAIAIGRRLGIYTANDVCLNSEELAEYVRLRRWEDIHNTTLFVRVTPEDKLSIVKALKAAGHYVAMTGDGINDAPAMKAANIGIAVGANSADVARESADFIITNGDYSVLPEAVAQGRQIYFNIRRAVRFLMLCSLSTIWVMLVGIIANLPLPMNPLQILWLNLAVHIFPGIALSFVPGETDIMNQPPRKPEERLLPWRSTAVIGLKSFVVAAAAIWIYSAEYSSGHITHAQTLVMGTLAICLLIQMLSNLSAQKPFYKMTTSLTPVFWLALLAGLSVQILAIYWGRMNTILQTIPLGWNDWIKMISMGIIVLALFEGGKIWLSKTGNESGEI